MNNTRVDLETTVTATVRDSCSVAPVFAGLALWFAELVQSRCVLHLLAACWLAYLLAAPCRFWFNDCSGSDLIVVSPAPSLRVQAHTTAFIIPVSPTATRSLKTTINGPPTADEVRFVLPCPFLRLQWLRGSCGLQLRRCIAALLAMWRLAAWCAFSVVQALGLATFDE